MTYNPGFDLQPPDPVPEVGEFLLPLCITQQQLLLIIECIELGGLSLGLGRQGAHIAPIWRALANLDNPSCGADETEQCITYTPYSSLVTYSPGGNPFLYDPNDDIPTGYAENPFYVYTPSQLPGWLPNWVTNNLAGLLPGDIVVTPEALIPGVSFPRNLANFLKPSDGLPTITVSVAGATSITLRLIEVPQGGQALIWFDDNILSTDVVETASISFNDVSLNDFLELVFDYELYREIIVERDIPNGAQVLNIMFVPDVGTAEVFGYGGGFRSFDLCGTVIPECEASLIRVSPEDNCQIQQLIGGVWTDVFRLDACAIPGQDGADGAPAPTPDVRIVPINGGRVVEFDMDADGTYEDSFTILDGANAAPIPQVAVNRIGDAVTVDFDMDADGNTDASFTVFDGVDGTNGTDGLTPDINIDPTTRIVDGQTQEGDLITFTVGSEVDSAIVWDGLSGRDGVTVFDYQPPGVDVTQKSCNVASYYADIVLQTLYAEVAAKRENASNAVGFGNALLGIAAALPTSGVSLILSASAAALFQPVFDYQVAQLTQDDVPAFWEEVREVLYCVLVERGNTGVINRATLNTMADDVAQMVTTYTVGRDVTARLLRSMELSSAEFAGVIGVSYDGNCNTFNCGALTFTEADYCAVAYYNAEKFTTLMLDALDGLARTGAFIEWYEEMNATIEGGIKAILSEVLNFTEAGTYYSTLESYQQSELDAIRSEIPFLRTAIREAIYCTPDASIAALDDALTRTPVLTQPTITTYNQARAMLTDGLWSTWTQIGVVDNRDADCASFNCGGAVLPPGADWVLEYSATAGWAGTRIRTQSPGGVLVNGVYESEYENQGGAFAARLGIRIDFTRGTDTTLIQLEADVRVTTGATNAWKNVVPGDNVGFENQSDVPATLPGDVTWVWTGTSTASTVSVNVDELVSPEVTTKVYAVRIYGTGAPPARIT